MSPRIHISRASGPPRCGLTLCPMRQAAIAQNGGCATDCFNPPNFKFDHASRLSFRGQAIKIHIIKYAKIVKATSSNSVFTLLQRNAKDIFEKRGYFNWFSQIFFKLGKRCMNLALFADLTRSPVCKPLSTRQIAFIAGYRGVTESAKGSIFLNTCTCSAQQLQLYSGILQLAI